MTTEQQKLIEIDSDYQKTVIDTLADILKGDPQVQEEIKLETEILPSEKFAVMVKESGLDESKSRTILEKFQDYFTQAEKWKTQSLAIQVTSEDQKMEMGMAREGRLFLRQKRLDVEKTRKELKENCLREGKAIDGFANILKALIEPIEEYLQIQEDFVKIKEQERIDLLIFRDDQRKATEEADRAEADRKEQERVRLENIELRKAADIAAQKAEEERKAHAAAIAKAEAERAAIEEAARKEREKAERAIIEVKAKADAEKFAIEEAARKEREAAEQAVRAAKEKAEAEKQAIADAAAAELVKAAQAAAEQARAAAKAADAKFAEQKQKEAKAKEIAYAKFLEEKAEKERIQKILDSTVTCPHCNKSFILEK